MKLGDAISRLDELKPNGFSRGQKIFWLSALDSTVKEEIIDRDIPILFVIFNRFDTAKQVFERIKEVQPSKLYIAADGPRENKVGESEKCQQVRDLVKLIDWNCEVKTLFRDKNLGCAKAVSGAISWLFENEEMGIILEDDCLPHLDFFPYCKELLEKYKDDVREQIKEGEAWR